MTGCLITALRVVGSKNSTRICLILYACIHLFIYVVVCHRGFLIHHFRSRVIGICLMNLKVLNHIDILIIGCANFLLA